ncbi:MAG: Rpp14/Pop5 family protein [Candidatus Woesearchaeota archaeon]
MLSLKALKPTKREKKRYIVYQIETDIKKSIQEKLLIKLKENLGIFSSAKAGIIPIQFDNKTKIGIMRVNHKMVDEIRANFVLISKIDNENIFVKTLGVSGILKKAKEFTIKNCEEK